MFNLGDKMNSIPALLDKNFKLSKKTNIVYYPEEQIHIIDDDKGVDIMDNNFNYMNTKSEKQNRSFSPLTF